LLIAGLVLVVVSALLELASVARIAAGQARTECSLIIQSITRQLDFLSREGGEPTLAALGQDPHLQQTLNDAIAYAPSVLRVAVCDTAGVPVALSPGSKPKGPLPRRPELPRVENLGEAFRVVWDLRDVNRSYQVVAPVALNERTFASIRIDVAGTFLREGVRSAFYKGVAGTVIFIAVVLAGGFFLSTIAAGRMRLLQASVSALREGRFDAQVPETGADEFGRLAHEINLLGKQLQEDHEKLGEGRALHRAVDLLGDGVLMLGSKGELVLVNSQACQWLALDRATAVNRRLDEMLPPSHPLRELGEALLAQSERTLSVRLASKEEKEALVAVGHRIEDPHEATAGILIEIQRVREHAAIHRLIDQSRALSRLGEMAAGMAHELRGPLQSLSLEIDGIVSELNQDPLAVETHARAALQKVKRLDRAITGFLRVARLRPPTLEALDVNALAIETSEALEPDANLAGLELHVQTSPELPSVLGDRQALRQALENLVRNAIQAQPARQARILVHTEMRGDRICVGIQDWGPGISPDQLPRVFDLFFTTRDEGSGVGLAVVRQTAELHGGSVEIVSEPDSGTMVAVLLPAAEAGVPDSPRSAGVGE
jgi:signal transduction histidine kinase